MRLAPLRYDTEQGVFGNHVATLVMKREMIFADIKDILWQELAIPPEDVALDSDLFKDFGVDGIDAETLLTLVADRLGVDFSNMEFEKHFGAETGFDPFVKFFPRWWRWHSDRVPVTPRILIDSIERGHWMG